MAPNWLLKSSLLWNTQHLAWRKRRRKRRNTHRSLCFHAPCPSESGWSWLCWTDTSCGLTWGFLVPTDGRRAPGTLFHLSRCLRLSLRWVSSHGVAWPCLSGMPPCEEPPAHRSPDLVERNLLLKNKPMQKEVSNGKIDLQFKHYAGVCIVPLLVLMIRFWRRVNMTPSLLDGPNSLTSSPPLVWHQIYTLSSIFNYI